jgi:diguanylate cyclase (GGDEF)-like protein/PAS domain S-box-containing protein
MRSKATHGRSLYGLLGGIIVAAVVLVLGGEATYTYNAQRHRMLEEMKQHAALSIATLQKNLAGLIESYAVNEYANLVATEIELRGHFAIVVHDRSMGKLLAKESFVSGKIRDAAGAVIDFDPDNPIHWQRVKETFFSASAPIVGPSGTELGRVAVYRSDEAMRAELNGILLQTLFKTLVILTLLSAFLLLTIRHLLIRPLTRITRVLERHDDDGIPAAPIPRIDYRELAPLTETMNTMIEAVKGSRESLKTERTRLVNVLEGTHVGTWEWNIQTGETLFNERWAEILGYTLAELAPISIDTWMKLAHPDDLQQSGALLKRHFSGELPYYETEARMRHKRGHWVWVLDRGKVATWTPEGKPLMMFGTHQEISERKALEQALLLQARTDHLTGLANRRHFMEQGREELVRARRYRRPLALLMLDIDHFKAINDTHGHEIGDLALQRIATRCREVLRGVDLIGRVGGEEFAIVLPETDAEGGRAVAERLRQAIAKQPMVTGEGREVWLRVSIGVTPFAGAEETDLDHLLREADQALYQAKTTGRDRVCSYGAT